MNHTHPPAQLWIGAPHTLEQKAVTYLQEQFCKSQSCKSCTICSQITAKQFYGLLWIMPEKSYTLEQIDPIFEHATLMLEPDQKFFFVLANVERLNASCANRLLKIMEEPPAGYHFILLANRLHQILPTIRSRCQITTCDAHTTYAHPLLAFFGANQTDPLNFMQILDANTPTEQESVELVDALLAYQYQEAIKNERQSTGNKITLLHQALKRPPMPGGSKIFWRNLFMQWHNAQKQDPIS